MLFDPRTRSWTRVYAGPPPRIAVAPGKLEIDAMRRSRRGIRDFATNVPPPPGGLGGGVSFMSGKLPYRQATAISFSLSAPETLGPTPTADLLYMTSSNCASKGCEALVSYFKDRNYEAAFMVWDWAHPNMPDGSQFVLTMPYADLQRYLIPLSVPSPQGEIPFNALQIVNSTRFSNDRWINEVFLHNNSTGERERVWQYSFQWPTKAADADYWWGPIFETFPDNAQYASAPALGFQDAVLLQDGTVRTLDAGDSDLSEPTSHSLVTLWEQRNSGLIACGTQIGLLLR